MPGISAIVALEGMTAPWAGTFERGLGELLHDPRYAAQELAANDFCRVAATSYPGYPISSLQVGDAQVVLDGHLYGCDPGQRAGVLQELVEIVRTRDDDASLRRWIGRTDGEYVVLIVDQRRGQLVVVNDLLGSLSLFHAQRSGVFVLSRELRQVVTTLDSPRFDRLAMAQHLLLGYPLGTATLLADVHRLAPASCLRLKKESEPRLRRLREIDFDDQQGAGFTVAENAAVLAEHFEASCAARAARASPAVVSLSGGFDSRAIAASLHRSGIPFRSATFSDHVGNTDNDVRIAESIASLFGSAWELNRLGPPRLAAAYKLLRLRTGMNSLGMTFLLPFLERIRDNSGAGAVLFTGESGTFTLPAHSPAVPPRDLRELAELILRAHARTPLTLVESLTGISGAELCDDLEQRLAAYPEKILERKLVHFGVYERRIKWEVEGQERNRCFLWSTDPFHSPEFFTRAMACPDAQKRLYTLYRELLIRLSPAAAAVAHAGLGAPITSPAFRARAKALELLRGSPELQGRLSAQHGPPRRVYARGSDVPRLLERQIGRCEALGSYLSRGALQRLVDDCGDHSSEHLDLVFTLTSAIEELSTGHSSLDESDAQPMAMR